eukprot:c21677_g1_i1.p1 GENE.c21677_g1_i1~~c21677_g1_i1.p1  ORF type:complete len:694 (+),score=196.72 c21677_g1_i1:691-2772(+)
MMLFRNDATNFSFIEPTQAASLTRMHSRLWIIYPSVSGSYSDFGFELDFISSDNTLICPYYGIRIGIMPISTVKSNNQCQSEKKFPKPLLQSPNDHDHIAWYIGTDDLKLAGEGKDWSHEISISVKETSRLSTVLGYYYVPLFMYFEISRMNDKNSAFYRHSDGDLVKNNGAFAHRFTVDLEPGDYVLRLRANTKFLDDQKYCFPYIYDAVLIEGTKPIVLNPEPISDLYLDEDVEVSIAFRFSEGALDYETGQSLKSLSENQLLDYVLLEDVDNQYPPVRPSSFRYEGVTIITKFFTNKMKPNSTYKLKIFTDQIITKKDEHFSFDNSKSLYRVSKSKIQTNEKIEIDAEGHKSVGSCGYGELLPNGLCKCLPGYTGLDCSRCADKFTPILADDELTCVINCGEHGKRKNKNECECEFSYQGSNCDECISGYKIIWSTEDDFICQKNSVITQPTPSAVPTVKKNDRYTAYYHSVDCGLHGKPAELSSKNPCVCNHGFSGTKCESCAPQYFLDKSTGVERCLASEACSSLICHSHGKCYTTQKQDLMCRCDKAFDGERCERCADGLGLYPNCVLQSILCLEPCLNGGQCDETIGKCLCPAGTSGSKCEVCNGPQCITDDLGEGSIVRFVRYSILLIATCLILIAVIFSALKYLRMRDEVRYRPVALHDPEEEFDLVGSSSSNRRKHRNHDSLF